MRSLDFSKIADLQARSAALAARAEKSFLMGPCGICFQMGVRGLISVNLGVLGMKKFENPWVKVFKS